MLSTNNVYGRLVLSHIHCLRAPHSLSYTLSMRDNLLFFGITENTTFSHAPLTDVQSTVMDSFEDTANILQQVRLPGIMIRPMDILDPAV